MIQLAHPWLLILLHLVLWLGWRVRHGAPAAFSRAPVTLRHPALARLDLASSGRRGHARLWLPIVLALLTLAATRPQTEGGWLPPEAEGRDILLLVDASPSMSIHDMTLDGKTVPRMAVLKQAAQGFISAREQDRMGLIVFSDAAATAVPLTRDHGVLAAQLERLTPGSTGAATAIGEGLGVAFRQIEARGGTPPVIVLFTDGDNTGGILRPREALAHAETLGLHLYTVAVTPDAPASETASDGLREPTLSEMSDFTGGAAYRAGDAESLTAILGEIDRREASHSPPPSERVKIEWYPIPLGLALLLLGLAQLRDLRTGDSA